MLSYPLSKWVPPVFLGEAECTERGFNASASSIDACTEWTQGSLNSPDLWFVCLNDGDNLALLWREEGNV